MTLLCTGINYYYTTTTAIVLPSIVDSVRDLRKINSNLLSDLQQSFCETINQNILLVDENTKLRADSSQVHMDISKLQPTLQLLNDVSRVACMHDEFYRTLSEYSTYCSTLLLLQYRYTTTHVMLAVPFMLR